MKKSKSEPDVAEIGFQHIRTNSQRSLKNIQKGIPRIVSPQSYANALGEGRTKVKTSTGPGIGPGTYNFPKILSPSFQFQTTPRFSRNSCYHIKTYSNDQQSQNIRAKILMAQNKDMNKYLPDVQLKQLKEKSRQYWERIQSTRQKKKQILAERKEKIQKKIHEKNLKIERALKRFQIQQLKHTWGVLLTSFAWIFLIKTKLEDKKLINQRIDKHARKFCIISRSVGKLKFVSFKIKRKLALQKLEKLGPLARFWINNRRRNNRNMIVDLLQRVAFQDLLITLMGKWQRRLIFIQKELKVLQQMKKIGLAFRKLMWNKVELGLCNKFESRRIRKTTVFEGFSSIPDHVKEYYIKKHLQTLFRIHNLKCEEYKIHLKKIFKKKRGRIVPTINISKPRETYYFSADDYKALINEAFQNRGNWNSLVTINKNFNS